MVSPMGSVSHITKTYGKRSGIKRKQPNEAIDYSRPESDINATPALKRRRYSPDLTEVVEQTPSPAKTDVDPDTNDEESQISRPPVKVVYGSRKATSLSVVQQSPSKPARDLSVIFDDIVPSTYAPSSPSKLARRMLSRSKTESSVEGQSSLQETKFERTPSLPNLPSPSKNEEPAASTLKTTASILPLITPSSTASVTRTYAGKFRSFLVPLPSSNSNDSFSNVIDEDELDTRESYSSLRNRWGVDNSEDDPYPYASPSPSKSVKSNLSTPDMSPSRHGRRKGKNTSSGTSHPIPMPDLMNLKSISELRNKGESRRFFDEVGYLFEGMDKSGGIGLRRASALEITTKLCDSEFTRKAKAADFFTRTWDVFLDGGGGKGEDKLLDTVLAFFVALVARDPVSLSELAHHTSSTSLSPPTTSKQSAKEETNPPSFLAVLFGMLERSLSENDPLLLVTRESTAGETEFKKAGIGEKDRLTLTSVYKIISSKSHLFSENTTISTSLLISYALHNLNPSLISTKYFRSFLTSLRTMLAPGTSTSLQSALGLRWRDTAESVPYETIYYHLRLLDTYLLGQWESPLLEGSQSQPDNDPTQQNEVIMDQARDTWLAEDLVSLGLCVELKGTSDDFEFAQSCLGTTLRILVSLTHANELWARKVLECEFTMGWLLRLIHNAGEGLQRNQQQIKVEDTIKSEEEENVFSEDPQEPSPDSSSLDTLCLVLGLFTNLVQIIKEAKDIVYDIRLNPSCTLQRRACARKCICSRPLSGIEILAQLYSSQQIKTEYQPATLDEDSPEARAEADASFIRGHLSVLFGLLMMDSPKNQSAILAALPTLSPMTSPNAKNLKMAKRAKMSRLVEQAKDFAAFFTAVSNRLGGDGDSKIVKEVVAFLETKRDSFL